MQGLGFRIEASGFPDILLFRWSSQEIFKSVWWWCEGLRNFLSLVVLSQLHAAQEIFTTWGDSPM